MVYELLEKGQANALPARELAWRIGCSVRDLSAIIQNERRQGLPICATPNAHRPGYFIAETPEELDYYCRSLKARAIAIFQTRKPLVKLLKEIQENENIET